MGGGSAGNLQTTAASSSSQAPRTSASGTVSTARSVETGRSSTPVGSRSHRGGDSASASSLGAARPSLSSSRGTGQEHSRGSGQEPNSPTKSSGTRGAPARAVGSAHAPRKRQESSAVAPTASGLPSPGTAPPPQAVVSSAATTASTPALSGARTARPAAAAAQASSPALRPSAMPGAADAETESREAGSAVLLEVNCPERSQLGESPGSCDDNLQASPSKLEGLSATAPASVRLPAEGGLRREGALQTAGDNGSSASDISVSAQDIADQEVPVSSPGQTSSEQVAETSSLRLSTEVPVEPISPNSPEDTHGAQPEQGLQHEAMVAAMTAGANTQEPVYLMSSLSPLSPIREVAEGGSTPKAIDAREVREMQEAREAREQGEARSNNVQRGQDVRGQLDLQTHPEEEQEEAPAAEGLQQLPSSKERYMQIRDRFLGK